MRVTFLGTAAAEGYPDAFCACDNCTGARALGGPSLRKRSSALIDDLLLLDPGPDLTAAAQAHDRSLAGLRWCLQTHEHADHLDPINLGARASSTTAARLHYYATRGALDRAAALLGGPAAEAGLAEPALADRLHLKTHVVAPGDRWDAGPYRVAAVPAAHDPAIVPVLYAIARDGRSLFYGTDTGPLPEAAWRLLRAGGHRFDVVILDHTFGLEGSAIGHLNGEQFREQLARFGDEGLLADGARAFAHHLGHHSNPPHPELVAYAAGHGYEVPFDGLTVEV